MGRYDKQSSALFLTQCNTDISQNISCMLANLKQHACVQGLGRTSGCSRLERQWRLLFCSKKLLQAVDGHSCIHQLGNQLGEHEQGHAQHL